MLLYVRTIKSIGAEVYEAAATIIHSKQSLQDALIRFDDRLALTRPSFPEIQIHSVSPSHLSEERVIDSPVMMLLYHKTKASTLLPKMNASPFIKEWNVRDFEFWWISANSATLCSDLSVSPTFAFLVAFYYPKPDQRNNSSFH